MAPKGIINHFEQIEILYIVNMSYKDIAEKVWNEKTAYNRTIKNGTAAHDAQYSSDPSFPTLADKLALLTRAKNQIILSTWIIPFPKITKATPVLRKANPNLLAKLSKCLGGL